MKGRKLLMIPGPIEFEPAVLQAMATPTTSHVAPDFIGTFGKILELMREVWQCPSGQPFVIAGSGTFAMDMPAANIVEPGDKALVISTGYFGDRYADLLKRYGAEVTILNAPLGGVVKPEDIENELKKGGYKIMTFTHVDTSTGVLVDPKPLGYLGNKYNVITILDGVCSIGGEKLKQEEWGIDIALTASQKAIGVPPGLALLLVSPKAMNVWKSRKTQVGNYYADWKNWLPIMEAYEQGNPAYFGTPPVNLIQALEVSLKQILSEGMDKRINRHQMIAEACRSALFALGLEQVPSDNLWAANTMSAPKYPPGVNGKDLLSFVSGEGVILAGGLHPEIKASYFRIGHMGAVNRGDVLSVIAAIESALIKCGYKFEKGAGLTAFQEKSH